LLAMFFFCADDLFRKTSNRHPENTNPSYAIGILFYRFFLIQAS
jgi:hypothetical protein